MSIKADNITEGSIARGIWNLAAPSMIGMVLFNLLSVADMYFVSRLGRIPLAAVTMGSIFIGVVYTFAMGVATGTIALAARFEGAGKREEAREVGRQAFYFGIFISVLVAFAGNLFIKPLLVFLGTDAEVLPDAAKFSSIAITYCVAIFIPMILNSYLRAIGDAVTPMWTMSINAVGNIALDPILIFGLFGLPALGVAGSAIAGVGGRLFGIAYLLHRISKKDSEFYIPLWPLKFDFDMFWRIFKIGIFSSIQNSFRDVSNFAMMKLVAVFGSGVVAAYGVGLRLQMVIFMPLMGLGVATSTMVGQNLGAGNPKRAEKSAWASVLAGEVMMVGAFLFFFFYADKIMGAFNKDPEVILYGTRFLQILAPTFFFINIGIILERAHNGAGDTISPLMLTIFSLFIVRFPLAWYLMKDKGPEGIWLGIAASIILQGLIFIALFSSGRWKKKKI